MVNQSQAKRWDENTPLEWDLGSANGQWISQAVNITIVRLQEEQKGESDTQPKGRRMLSAS